MGGQGAHEYCMRSFEIGQGLRVWGLGEVGSGTGQQIGFSFTVIYPTGSHKTAWRYSEKYNFSLTAVIFLFMNELVLGTRTAEDLKLPMVCTEGVIDQ